MKKRIIAILLCAMSFSVFAAKLNIQHWTTKNGAKVLFVRSKALSMLDLRVIFNAGSAYDGQNFGLANLTANVLRQGTKTLSANQIADGFDRVGAEYDVNVNQDMAVLSLRTLTKPNYFNKAINTFVDVLGHPMFPERGFNRVKRQLHAQIKVNAQTPDDVAGDAFMTLLYGDQPYGHDTIGTAESLSKITQTDATDFYNQYYVAKNAIVVMVGDLTTAQAKTLSDQITGVLKVGSPAKVLPMSVMTHSGEEKHIVFPSEQTSIMYGMLGISRYSPEYFPLIVGNTVLGQLPLTSLLYTNVRETKGLAYYAVSGFDPLKYKGPFLVRLKTRADKTQEAIQVVRQTVANYVQNGPTAKQLQMAKKYLSGSFPLSVATNKSIANVLVNMAFYDRPLNFLDTYLGRVNAVSPAQVKAAFQKILDPKKMILVTVGPKK